MIDLEEIAVALDAFPHWDESMRAEVFHAIDVAPETYIDRYDFDQAQEYFSGPASRAWRRIRKYLLETPPENIWMVTLEEAAGGESAPTKEEILKALYRGARMIR